MRNASQRNECKRRDDDDVNGIRLKQLQKYSFCSFTLTPGDGIYFMDAWLEPSARIKDRLRNCATQIDFSTIY